MEITRVISEKVFNMINNGNYLNSNYLSYDVEDYLFDLYYKGEINGFSGVIIEKTKISFEFRRPHNGSWVILNFVFQEKSKFNNAYDQAMKGL